MQNGFLSRWKADTPRRVVATVYLLASIAQIDMDHEGEGGVDWGRMYRRQVERAGEAPAWFDALGLGSGDNVVEVGCGPGHMSLLAAERVEPGTVCALDRSAGALAYLMREAGRRGTTNVAAILTDATALGVSFTRPVSALVTYILHHAEDPAAVLAELAGAIRAGSQALVCEYRPEAAGEVGPPLDMRIAPAVVEQWILSAGFDVERKIEYPNESYGFVLRR